MCRKQLEKKNNLRNKSICKRSLLAKSAEVTFRSPTLGKLAERFCAASSRIIGAPQISGAEYDAVPEYYIISLKSSVSPWTKPIVSHVRRRKTCTRQVLASRVRECRHLEGAGSVCGGTSPLGQSAITQSSTEAGSHHAAEKQRSSPSQLNLTGVSGVNNETGHLVLKVLGAHPAHPAVGERKKILVSERDYVETRFHPT